VPKGAFKRVFLFDPFFKTRQFGKATFLLKKPGNPRWRKSSWVCGHNKKMGEISVPKGASREYFYSICL
jgi:hypothetical protein